MSDMEVVLSDVEQIPTGNLHVPRDRFVAVWRAAEDQASGADGRTDWYAIGVVETCRWLACVIVRRASGGLYRAYAPVTNRTTMAIEELIEQEYVAADKLALRRPMPNWLTKRPGWLDGVCATLHWAWARTGPPPLSIRSGMPG